MEYTATLSGNEPVAITIGNFDGIHKGHQHLIYELRRMAEHLSCRPVVVTFSPHTLMVVRPDLYVRYLTTLDEKLALIKQFGLIDDSIVIHFTPEVASMSAEAFMDSLRARFPIRGLVVGENFSLGHERKGDVNFLTHYGQQHDIQVRAIPLKEADSTRISSTRIRALVGEGEIATANELLGHPVLVSGIVQHGDQRGRLLGYPTANLKVDPHKLLPANGIYAGYVRIQDTNSDGGVSPTVYKGAISVGVRPQFNGKERLVEVYLLDVDLDLYDKLLSVDFIARLRDEQRFARVEDLIAQMAVDVEQTRQILATRRVSH